MVAARPEIPVGWSQFARQQQLPQPYPDSYAPPGPPPNVYGPPPPIYGAPALDPVITKNVYVHVAPEEHELIPAIQVSQPAPPRKHYKIIFIKAPNPPKYQAPIIPPQNQDEHKTLVYVLVKKPDPQPDVVVPTAVPTQPSKPEVYFIKYKNKEEAVIQPGYGPPKGEYGPPPLPKEEYGE